MRTLRNINKDTEGVVQEFIGTAYDDVKFVADNMATIQLVVDAINDLNPSAFATAAQGLLADSAIQLAAIDTFAKLSGILTDGTLVKSTDVRLSDARTALAHTHVEADMTDLKAYLLAADLNTLAKINAIIADATLIDTTDARLSDARTPLTHAHSYASLTGLPTTLVGYGITNAYTKTEVDAKTYTFASLLSKPITLVGYGITDAAPLSHIGGNSHIDWTLSGGEAIHSSRYVDTNTIYTHPATHPWSMIISKPTTLSGYGIIDGNAGLTNTAGYLLPTSINTLTKINAILTDGPIGAVADFATAAQGALADTALQALTVNHDDLAGFVLDEHLPSSTFATAAQGVKADTAVQPGALGTAAAENVAYFATAAQGALADTALQAGAYATAAQGVKADTATQPADLVTALIDKLTYKGGYDATGNSPDLDVTPVPVLAGDVYKTTVTGLFYGAVTLEVDDILIATVANPTSYLDWMVINKNINPADFATAAEGVLASTALQPSDIDTLNELNILVGADLIDTNDPRLLPFEGTALKATGVTTGFVATAVGDNTTTWAAPSIAEGTAIKSTSIPVGRVLAANGVVGAGNGCNFIVPFTYASQLAVKGDLETFDTARTTLGVGATNTVLTADSTLAKGLKWAALPTPPTAGMTHIYTNINRVIGNKEDIFSLSGLTHTLPSSPIVGTMCIVRDYTKDAVNNPITINRNGALINGIAADVALNKNSQVATFLCNATGNWIYSSVSLVDSDMSAFIKVVAAASYTILDADSGYRLIFDWPTAIAVTLPDGLMARHNFIATQVGVGVPTITPTVPGLLNGAGVGLSPDAQWGSLNIVQYQYSLWLGEYTKAGSYLSLPG